MSNLTLNEYQKKASETALYPKEHGVTYTVLGLNGEAGEIADKYKKVIRDQGGELTSEMKDSLMKELGDVLWYVAMCANELGYDLDAVASKNLEKLFSRKERGKIQGSGDNR